jgi:hypothetical protein
MMRTIVFATSVLLMLDAAAAQMRAPVVPGGASNLAAAANQQSLTPLPCNGVGSCNVLIAKCAEREGTWVQKGESPIGQPSAGICYFR